MGHRAEGLSIFPVCYLCFLTVEAVTSCPLLLLPGLLHHDGLYHQTRSWKNSFFFKKLLVRLLGKSNRHRRQGRGTQKPCGRWQAMAIVEQADTAQLEQRQWQRIWRVAEAENTLREPQGWRILVKLNDGTWPGQPHSIPKANPAACFWLASKLVQRCPEMLRWSLSQLEIH